MPDLNDLMYFAKVVEHGGFAAAGRRLGIPKSRLSRRIAELEARLGVRLLQRTTRKLALTEVGERYLRHCQAMLLEAEQAEEAVASLSNEPRGRIRVSCPNELARTGLNQVVTSFLLRYPLVQLEVVLSNRRVDLLNEGIDVALRVREQGDEDPSLISRQLSPAAAYLIAAPALVAGIAIDTPEDLQRLPALGAVDSDRRIHQRLKHIDGSRRDVVLEARLSIEDFEIRKEAALLGLGFSMLPQMHCQQELDDGRLLRLLPDWELPGGHLQAVYPHRRGMLPAVRAWIEHLSQSREHGGLFQPCGLSLSVALGDDGRRPPPDQVSR
ncbi:LysR substrate-binding domain-containing protein [Phytopseudomonas dryadis]|uniref:LysR family transcriptional regulator n=1 Tax=Phytopseudomonas dryadis TaxID=2487520 RepID=A0A4Q9RAT4_9GAMM|nr:MULTISPECIES: LysR substrate-binding domain-containing protein [Pseudomonas]TBU97697.1 LysR family transcriptional regulator [Pseudomonas dryadis]TBV10172.1 LysR family transcriptional regulator [Pseudomonas dryadis]TBV19193.1 LysR family transcriptional regulator [Pseudomonas sp. FRB 230]